MATTTGAAVRDTGSRTFAVHRIGLCRLLLLLQLQLLTTHRNTAQITIVNTSSTNRAASVIAWCLSCQAAYHPSPMPCTDPYHSLGDIS